LFIFLNSADKNRVNFILRGYLLINLVNLEDVKVVKLVIDERKFIKNIKAIFRRIPLLNLSSFLCDMWEIIE